MSVVIVDYGSGNLMSAQKALEQSSRELINGPPIVVSRDPEALF